MPELKQIAAMNAHYVQHSLNYFLETQQRLGLRVIELWCAAPHVLLDMEGCFDMPELRRAIRSHGLEVGVVTPENCIYPYQFAAADPELRRRSRRYFESGIRLAQELDCPLMAVNSGWGNRDEDADEAWKRSAEMLSGLAEYAEGRGVTLVMESLRPEESQLVHSLESCYRMWREISHANLKVMVDTCAMGVAGETLEEWFSVFGSDIRHMHFVDGTPYGHLAWGDGNRDLSAALQTLDSYSYKGLLGQEITDGRYYLDPAACDERNMSQLRRHIGRRSSSGTAN